jgi:hypothetical protein
MEFRTVSKHDKQHRYIPGWQRPHADWRFILGVVVMLAAIMIYVASEDLSWRPR